LYLYDEYSGNISDQNNNLVSEVPTHCTGPENHNPATDASNASASGAPQHLTVKDPKGKPYPGAIVALHKQTGRVIGQGFTDRNGRLKIY